MTVITDEMRKELAEKPEAEDGEFIVTIDGCSAKTDQNGQGYSLLELTVTEGAEEGSHCNERLYIFPKEIYEFDDVAKKRTKIAYNKIASIGKIFDVTISNVVTDLNKLAGKTLRVIRTKSPAKNDPNKFYTNNVKFLAVAEEQEIPLA